jgi:hypothetical protein
MVAWCCPSWSTEYFSTIKIVILQRMYLSVDVYDQLDAHRSVFGLKACFEVVFGWHTAG